MLVSEAEAIIGPKLSAALAGRGYTALTDVQSAILDAELAAHDLRISSKTGSGKTVALGLVVRDLVSSRPEAPEVLVITPTRELAKQVEEELRWLFAPTGATTASVTGGASYRDELRALGQRPSIVVGTPGRLLDHLSRGSLVASGVRAAVLDEADRMLDLGFRDDIETILNGLPEGRRTHLVSATYSHEVRALADRIQQEPRFVAGTPLGEANQDIEHVVHLVQQDERLSAIINLLLATPGAQTLIFARTRADVADLCDALRDAGFLVAMLSGEMDQPERNRALSDFKRGRVDALVATDVAARGIDVSDIARVIHVEAPGDVDAYTHRSGRTGRAGRKGTSSVIATPQNLGKTERLLARARVRFRFEPVPTREQILALRGDRVVDLLLADPNPEDPSPFEPDAALLTLAQRIAEAPQLVRAIGRLLSRANAAGPAEPRDVTPLDRPKRLPAAAREGRLPRERYDRPEHQDRPPRQDRPQHFDQPERPERPRTVPRPPPGSQSFELFRVAWGQAHGADARRLLAMACRRGEIESRDIGAIRIMRTHSTIEVDRRVASQFEHKTRDPDPRDPRATIKRAPLPSSPGHAESPLETRAIPDPRPSEKAAGRAVPTARPSERARAIPAAKPSERRSAPAAKPSEKARPPIVHKHADKPDRQHSPSRAADRPPTRSHTSGKPKFPPKRRPPR